MKTIAALSVCLSVCLFADQAAECALCPFCDAPSLTLAEQVDQAAHLVLGKWVGGEKPTNETAGTAEFEILDVAKTKGDVFKKGD